MKKSIKILGVLILIISICGVGILTYLKSKAPITDLGVREIPYMRYIAITKKNIAMKEYPSVMEEAFGKLKKQIEVNGDNEDNNFGKPFTIYVKSSEGDNYDLVMGYQLNHGRIGISDDDVNFGTLEPLQVMSFELNGAYSYLPYAWVYAMAKVAANNEYEINNDRESLEIYEVSYDDGVEPENFKTIINIPVRKK